MADPNNCRKFYRCVKNGDKFSRHEFLCAKGTGWSEEKQTCDYSGNIERCNGQMEEPETTTSNYESTTTEKITSTTYSTTTSHKPTDITTSGYEKPTTTTITNEQSTTTTSTTDYETTQSPTSTQTSSSSEIITTTMQPISTTPIPNLPPGTQCTAEGFMADPNNCRKFYRCVQNGEKLTKHEFMCAKGTGWSEEKQTCDYAENIERCKGQIESPETSTTMETTNTYATTTNKPTTMETPTTIQQETQPTEPSTKPTEMTTINVQSTKPTEPPTKPTETPATTPQTKPTEMPTTEQQTKPTEMPTTKPTDITTTEQPTKPTETPTKPTEISTTTEQTKPTDMTTTTEQQTKPTEMQTKPTKVPTTTTNMPTTTAQVVTSDKPGYDPSTMSTMKPTDYTTTEISSTEEYISTTLEPINFKCTNEGFFPDPEDCNRYYRCVDANQNGNFQVYSFRCPDGTVWDTSVETCNYAEQVSGNCSSGANTTEYPVTNSTSKPVDTTTMETTIMTTNGITEETTIKPTNIPLQTTTQVIETTTTIPDKDTTTTEQTTTEKPTEPPTTEITTSEENTTNATVETTEIPTIQPQPTANGTAPCPPTSNGQQLFICPTGFKRHPKSCNMFYQCTERAESNDLSIVVFECPNGTVYHEQRNLCDKPNENDECLNKAMARTAFYEDQVRRMHMVQIRSTAPLCPDEGHFALNNDDCSQLFVKCGYSLNTGRLEGQIYRCPKGFAYWSVSRRCERAQKLLDCKPTQYDISDTIPVEWGNIGNRRRNLKI